MRLSPHALWICASLLPACAQEVRIASSIYAPPPPTISTQASLVQLLVTVRDPKDHAVGGLAKQNFEVLDAGVRQPITIFAANRASSAGAAPASEPRTLAFFFDDTHAEVAALQAARNAASRFVESSMLPGDRAGIFTTSGTETVDFTADRAALAAALARLRPHTSGAHAVSVCPALSEFEAYAITRNLDADIKREAVLRAIACNCPPPPPEAECVARQPLAVQSTAEMLWDHYRAPSSTALQVLELVVRHLARAPGRRILLMLSPGLILDRMEKQTSALVDSALRAQIVIHGIDAAGLQSNRRAGSRQIVLEELMSNLAGATGGRLVHNNNDIFGGIAAASAEPENSYLLGFSPTREPDDAWHPLKVRLLDADGRVETRPGYFAGTAKQESVQQRLDRIAASTEPWKEIASGVSISHAPLQSGAFPIRVEIRVDAAALPFANQDGRAVQQLTFVTVLEDQHGEYVAGRQALMDLALTPPSLAELKRDGIRAALTLRAPAGSYRIRVVLREAVRNRISATTSPLVLP